MSTAFDKIHKKHIELFQNRKRLPQDELVAESSDLLSKIIDAGIEVADTGDRSRLGSYASFWADLIYDITDEFPDTTLKNVDSSYAHEDFVPPIQRQLSALELAQNRLAELPINAIPAVAPLPEGSYLPYSPNPYFTDRMQQLLQLAVALKGMGVKSIDQPQIVGVTGMGGVGKSQLASEFAHRYGQYFAAGVAWISFSDASALSAEVINACQNFPDLPLEMADRDQPDQVRMIRKAWQSAMPRLLIFDNCEDEKLLAEWLPTSGGARVLITSRRGYFDSTINVGMLPLQILPRLDSINLMRRFRPDLSEDDPLMDALAAELGDLPLALYLAGSYLIETRFDLTLGDYLARLKGSGVLKNEAFVQSTANLPTDHDQHVARTFRISLERLDEAKAEDKVASALLARAARFAPGEPIPRWLLFATLNLEDTDTAQIRANGVRRLTALGLIEVAEDGRLRLHPLLAQFVLDEVDNANAQSDVIYTLLDTAGRLNNIGDPRPLFIWQPHLRHIVKKLLPRRDELTARACNELGYHLRQAGDLEAARPYYEQALAIRIEILGEHHPDTATSLNNLGALLQTMGDYAEARPHLEQALAIYQEALGEHHPDTATGINNLGALLSAMGDLAGSRSYYEQALDIRRNVLGEQHPDTAQSLNNLGYLLQEMGDLVGARPYQEQALAIRREVLGEQHPDTAQSLNNLGMLLQGLGYLSAALPYLERALAIRMEVLGEWHPGTATSLNNLGYLLQFMGKLEAARPYHEQALAINEEVLGVQHIATATSLNNLGMLLQELGMLHQDRSVLSAAYQCFDRALPIVMQVLGDEHPNTRTVRANLKDVIVKIDELSELLDQSDTNLGVCKNQNKR